MFENAVFHKFASAVRPSVPFLCLCASILFILVSSAPAQNNFEGRRILSPIEIVFEGLDSDVSALNQFRSIAENELGETYSTVRIRNALEKLYETDRIVLARVEAEAVGADQVNLRFVIRRKTVAKRVTVNVGQFTGDTLTEQQLLLRLNILPAGSTISERILQQNANQMLTYLRERGFFKAEVTYTQEQLDNETEVNVTFNVVPSTQAQVDEFIIDIDNFDKTELLTELELQKGSFYSRFRLNRDVDKVRQALQEANYLAPVLNEPRVIYDNDTNTVDIEIQGEVGPTVTVEVDVEQNKPGERTQTELIPIKREGTLDYSAIVEGERRL